MVSMQVQKSFQKTTSYGKLYLIPTPIGNLQDITYRTIGILNKVDFICAEDTRNTGLLLKHFNILTKQISFHEFNAYERIPKLIDFMKEGKDLAQVSDAGMPSISDPGHDLVKAAIAENISVIAIPGATAGITALIASGLAPQPHVFYGFLPRKATLQKEFLQSKKHYPETQIFYESPYRVINTLKNMLSVYGDRQIVLVRELTKCYEEYQRGCISEILSYLSENSLRGECLILVSGYEEEKLSDGIPIMTDILDLVTRLVESGEKPNQAIKKIAKTYNLNRQDVYNAYHRL